MGSRCSLRWNIVRRRGGGGAIAIYNGMHKFKLRVINKLRKRKYFLFKKDRVCMG
jgi:hypothetical protein